MPLKYKPAVQDNDTLFDSLLRGLKLAPSKEPEAPSAEPEPVRSKTNRVPDWMQHLAGGVLRVAGPVVGSLVGGGLGAAAGAPAAGVGAIPGASAGAIGGGAAGGAVGETLAEMIEPNKRSTIMERLTGKTLSAPRVVASGAIGAIPGTWAMKAGNIPVSMAKGAAVGGLGTAMTKASMSPEHPGEAFDPRTWSLGEWAGPAGGALVGGVMGKFSTPPPPAAPTPAAMTPEEALARLKAVGMEDFADNNDIAAGMRAGPYRPTSPQEREAHQVLAREQATRPKGKVAKSIGDPLEKVGATPSGDPVWGEPSLSEMEALQDEATASTNTLKAKLQSQFEDAMSKRNLKFIDDESKSAQKDFAAAMKAKDARTADELTSLDDEFQVNLKGKEARQAAEDKLRREIEIAAENAAAEDKVRTAAAKNAEDLARKKAGMDVQETITETDRSGTKENAGVVRRVYKPKEEGDDLLDTPDDAVPFYDKEIDAYRAGASVGDGRPFRVVKSGSGYRVVFTQQPTLPPTTPTVPKAGTSKFDKAVEENLKKIDEMFPGSVPPKNPPTEPPPAAPPAVPKKKGPKGGGGSSGSGGAAPSGPRRGQRVAGPKNQASPETVDELKRMSEEMSSFPFTDKIMREAGRGRGGSMEVVRPKTGGAEVFHDIRYALGETARLGKVTRKEVAQAIKDVLEGKGNSKLHTAVREIAADRLANPDKYKGPTYLPRTPKAGADDVVGLANNPPDDDIRKFYTGDTQPEPVAELPFALEKSVGQVKGKQGTLFGEPIVPTKPKPKGPPAPLPLFDEPEPKAPAGRAAKDAQQGIAERRINKEGKLPAGYSERRMDELVRKFGGREAVPPQQLVNRERQLARDLAKKLGTPDDAQMNQQLADHDLKLANERADRAVREMNGGTLPKKGDGGTTVSALGAGQLDTIKRIIEQNPQFALRLGTGAVGAGIGATQDEEDPLRGAVLGGALGYGGGAMASKVPGLLGQGANLSLDPIKVRFPNYVRSSLLSDPRSIFHNSVAGPWGSNVAAGIEEYTKGLVNQDRMQKEVGKKILKSASPLSWIKKFSKFVPEAQERIFDVEELGRYGQYIGEQGEPGAIDKIMRGPATLMMTGDLNTKFNLTAAGLSEEMARRYGLTAEVRRALWRNMANFGKAGTDTGKLSNLATLMLPFKRTAANIMEMGTERTPILGWLINTLGDDALRVSGSEILVQQMLGTAAFGIGYEAGLHTPPESNRLGKIHSLIGNLGGPYALLTGAGFSAGQAVRNGRSAIPTSVSATINAYEQSMPLPTTQGLTDLARPVMKGLRGQPVTARDLGANALIPKVVPGLKEIWDAAREELGPAPTSRVPRGFRVPQRRPRTSTNRFIPKPPVRRE